MPRRSAIGSLFVAGLVGLVSLAGCSGLRPGPPPGEAAAAKSAPAPASPTSNSAPAAAAHPPPGAPTGAPTAATATLAPATAESPAAKAATPAGAGAAKPQVAASGKPPSVPAAEAATAAKTPAGAVKPATAALDLPALEQRLRDTHAIGVFTKLSLKNQVDDLLGEFRAFHGGRSRPPLTDLRQHYDLLLMKVLTLLQDGDPPLASAILASREAIWAMLSDPEKFHKIQLG